MSKKMLIDASHVEETRVVILSEQKLEEFDFETSTKKQLKGNVYLARVVRVEPSLQAAFVEFGGNRHGFLAFNEIHPDYYRIPIEDREKLLKSRGDSKVFDEEQDFPQKEMDELEEETTKEGKHELILEKDENEFEEHTSPLSKSSLRPYKIQEVIKRRQIMLVQVVKDERGGKGAALTTFVSFAGRYCVLMPNTPRGGGISRKIADLKDRKRLREMINGFAIPEGMGLIVRTAGLGRTKTEIKRDFDYLLRLWGEIRDQTLSSTAPSLIYAEGDLITRSVRDLYHKDITDIFIEGEEGYKKAKSLMRMLTPSHAKRVQLYKDPRIPLFQRYAVEDKLDNIHNSVVQLPSGGYLVINTTEALVAIDVNSGKATRERHIEETALKTNLEAAEEIGRQLRLRDLAGLIVVDFIDMEASKNNHLVERRFREAVKEDRARIQIGSISIFGLLEMSRQRMRPSLIEASTAPCSHCRGTGVLRSVESSSLRLLRALETQCIEGSYSHIKASVPTAVAFYILNQKRASLNLLETRYQLIITIIQDNSLIPPDFLLETLSEKAPTPVKALVLPQDFSDEDPPMSEEFEFEDSSQDSSQDNPQESPQDKSQEKSKKRNRRNRDRHRRLKDPHALGGGSGEQGQPQDVSKGGGESSTPENHPVEKSQSEEGSPHKKARRPRNRYQRQGRYRTRSPKESEGASEGASENKRSTEKEPGTEKEVFFENSSPSPIPLKTKEKASESQKNRKKGWWQRFLES